jgi:transposase
MKELLDRCCGIDVHRDSLSVCIMLPQGKRTAKQVRKFGTTTRQIRSLAQWLRENNISDVVMESTGVYWVPVFNLLEEYCNIVIANPRNVKNVPGRKTDRKDCEWLCRLLKNGLIEKSFIPPEDLRAIRDLNRFRVKFVQDRTRAKNRVVKILEAANIKLASVLSDVHGKTGWGIVVALSRGETCPEKLTEDLPKRIKAPREKIMEALEGRIKPHQQLMLRQLIQQIQFLDTQVAEVMKQIEKASKPHESLITLIEEIPGIDSIAAQAIIGEIGVDMSHFPTEQQLTSWACVAPGNHESAGKKMNTHIRKGQNFLKPILVQVAWAASRTKNTFFSEKYKRLVRRLGRKRALIALGRKILAVIYRMLKSGAHYKELGVDYLDKQKSAKSQARYYMKRLRAIGFEVDLRESEAGA